MLRTYKVQHKNNQIINDALDKALQVANYAVANKKNKKLLSSKYVKDIGLPSTISNQILRKYGKGKIKAVKNINLIISGYEQKYKTKSEIKVRNNIIHENGRVILQPLNLVFRWEPGENYERITQVEINKEFYMITALFKRDIKKTRFYRNEYLGIDLNCGVGRHIANMADIKNNHVINLGKEGPNTRKKYANKRKNQKVQGNKEKRIMKDLDHKISRKIVDYAKENNLVIVMEDLKGIRNNRRKTGKGSKGVNRVVNSWSFYRLQTFVAYKAKEHNIPVIKVKPHYTSKKCSYCGHIGKRDSKDFVCKSKKCKSYNIKRNADVNAAYNIAFRGREKIEDIRTTVENTLKTILAGGGRTS